MISVKNISWLKFIIIAIILIIMGTQITACSCGGPENKTTSTPSAAATALKDLKVPVNLKGARAVGSLHMEIVYDPAVVSANGVEAGELGANSMIEFNSTTPGRVKVGIVDATGITGDGTVITVSFKALDKNKTSQLNLENLGCYNAKTLVDIILRTSPGKLVPADGSFTALEVTFVN
jgi:hypothetical protein